MEKKYYLHVPHLIYFSFSLSFFIILFPTIFYLAFNFYLEFFQQQKAFNFYLEFFQQQKIIDKD